MAILQGGLMTVLLAIASYTDIKKRIIPDTVCVLVVVTALLNYSPWNLLGIFVALPLLIAAYLSNGFGGGDIKLMAAVGMILGFECGLLAMILAFIAELLFYLFYSITQKLRHREQAKSLPFAPFLAVGVLTVYFINTGGSNLWVF